MVQPIFAERGRDTLRAALAKEQPTFALQAGDWQKPIAARQVRNDLELADGSTEVSMAIPPGVSFAGVWLLADGEPICQWPYPWPPKDYAPGDLLSFQTTAGRLVSDLTL